MLGFSDLDRIQTCNLLSRNQVRYSVAPRGLLFGGANISKLYCDIKMKRTIFLFFLAFFLLSCKKQQTKNTADWEYISQNVQLKDDGASLSLKTGKFSYTIAKSRLPFRKAILLNASLVGYFTELGIEGRIIGISSPEYVYSENIRSKVGAGTIENVGNEQKYDVEKIIALKPEVIFTNYISTFENTYEIIRKNGIEIIFLDEYLENEPLDKTRYLLVFGELFDVKDQAEKRLKTIADRYDSLKVVATQTTEKPLVLANEMYGNQWFLPGGKSMLAKFIADANASYINADSESSGAVPMSFEEVFAKAGDAQYWVNVGNHKTKRELLQINPNYTSLPVYNEGQLFTVTQREQVRANDYFEEGVVRADKMLEDYIRIFHPTLLPPGALNYLKELK